MVKKMLKFDKSIAANISEGVIKFDDKCIKTFEET